MVCSLQRKVTSLSLALKEAKAVSTGNNRRMSTSAYFIYFKVHCEKLFCGAVSSSRGLARGLWAAEREMEGWTPRLRLWPDPSVLFLEKILKRWQSSKFWPESRASQVMQCGEMAADAETSAADEVSPGSHRASPSDFPSLCAHNRLTPTPTVAHLLCIMERQEHIPRSDPPFLLKRACASEISQSLSLPCMRWG